MLYNILYVATLLILTHAHYCLTHFEIIILRIQVAIDIVGVFAPSPLRHYDFKALHVVSLVLKCELDGGNKDALK